MDLFGSTVVPAVEDAGVPRPGALCRVVSVDDAWYGVDARVKRETASASAAFCKNESTVRDVP